MDSLSYPSGMKIVVCPGVSASNPTNGDGPAWAYFEVLARNDSPLDAVAFATQRILNGVDATVVGCSGFAGGARHGMAWHGQNAEVSA